MRNGAAPPAPAASGLRPLTARSVLASTLLGADPPELPVAYLCRMAALFGINENRARVALSRMVQAGEATTDGEGRYRLSGRLLERQQRQQASRSGRTRQWRGEWVVAVVTAPPSPPEARAARREALVRLRLSQLREGVWVRPDNLELEWPAVLADDLTVVTGRLELPPGRTEPALADELFALAPWAQRAEALRHELARLEPVEADALAPGFVLSAAVLRHLQADPLLPDALLAPSWPGSSLRRDYEAWDAAYRRLLAEWARVLA